MEVNSREQAENKVREEVKPIKITGSFGPLYDSQNGRKYYSVCYLAIDRRDNQERESCVRIYADNGEIV